jgi:AcrR family transcriptional regulator
MTSAATSDLCRLSVRRNSRGITQARGGRVARRLHRADDHVSFPDMNRSRRKPRRTQAERRSETQAAILSASIQILTEDGYAGFSASRVAARAGVSRGAQEHYFPTKNDLIAAATRHAMREAVEHAQLLARTATRSSDPIAKFLMDSEHFFFKPSYGAMIEIMIAARSDRALARIVNPIVQDARHVLNGIWTDTLDAAGFPRENAQQFIELSHYLLRGLFLVSNWLPYKIDRATVIEAWRRLAPTVLQLGRPDLRRGRRPPARPRPRRAPHTLASAGVSKFSL